MDVDEFALLGSRFISAVREDHKPVSRKRYRDNEADDKRASRSRPYPIRDRSY